jgi:hypothetical protein
MMRREIRFSAMRDIENCTYRNYDGFRVPAISALSELDATVAKQCRCKLQPIRANVIIGSLVYTRGYRWHGAACFSLLPSGAGFNVYAGLKRFKRRHCYVKRCKSALIKSANLVTRRKNRKNRDKERLRL